MQRRQVGLKDLLVTLRFPPANPLAPAHFVKADPTPVPQSKRVSAGTVTP